MENPFRLTKKQLKAAIRNAGETPPEDKQLKRVFVEAYVAAVCERADMMAFLKDEGLRVPRNISNARLQERFIDHAGSVKTTRPARRTKRASAQKDDQQEPAAPPPPARAASDDEAAGPVKRTLRFAGRRSRMRRSEEFADLPQRRQEAEEEAEEEAGEGSDSGESTVEEVLARPRARRRGRGRGPHTPAPPVAPLPPRRTPARRPAPRSPSKSPARMSPSKSFPPPVSIRVHPSLLKKKKKRAWKPPAIGMSTYAIALALVVATITYAVTASLHGPPTPFCESSSEQAVAVVDGDGPQKCQPCPEHGVCHSGVLMECHVGYVRSVAGAVCVRDEMHVLRVSTLLERMLTLLRKARGMYMCNESGSPMLSREELLQTLHEYFPREHYKVADLGHALEQANELPVQSRVQVNQASQGKFFLASHPHDYTMPLACMLQHQLARYAHVLIGMCAAVALGVFVYTHRRHRKREEKLVRKLHSDVLDVLSTQVQLAGVPHEVSVENLRDEFLEEKNKSTLRVWQRVEERVQDDSRVAERTAMVHGHRFRVWEWIGTTTPRKLAF